MIDGTLVGGVQTDDGLGALLVHVGDSVEHALAHVAVGVAVAQLDGLELARGGTGGNDGASHGAVCQSHLHLDGGIAAGVEDLAGVNELNDCHGACPSLK